MAVPGTPERSMEIGRKQPFAVHEESLWTVLGVEF